jgi:hypothetical protein
MSTLKVTTIQDTSGSNSSTTDEIYSGRAKAWVNFNGTGTVAIRDDFNAGSITDNGTGDYTITFDSAFANADYMWTGSIMSTSNLTITRSLQLHKPTTTSFTSPTASNIRVRATDFNNANATDQEYVTLIVYA